MHFIENGRKNLLNQEITIIKLGNNNEKIQRKNAEDTRRKELKQQKEYLDKIKDEKLKEQKKYPGYGDELFIELKKLKKNSMSKFENKESNKDNIIKKKKKINKSVSIEKNEKIKSKKNFHYLGFNMYKDIISNKLRNNSENK